MKRVIRCLGCQKIKRYYGSYAVKLMERTTNVLTGEIKEQEVKGKICSSCAYEAGYKQRSKKFKVRPDDSSGPVPLTN